MTSQNLCKGSEQSITGSQSIAAVINLHSIQIEKNDSRNTTIIQNLRLCSWNDFQKALHIRQIGKVVSAVYMKVSVYIFIWCVLL